MAEKNLQQSGKRFWQGLRFYGLDLTLVEYVKALQIALQGFNDNNGLKRFSHAVELSELASSFRLLAACFYTRFLVVFTTL